MIIDHTMVHPDVNVPYLREQLPESLIEHAARTCYRSMDKFGTNPQFISKLIEVKHLDVLEHVYFTVEFEVKRPEDLYVWYYKMNQRYPYAHIELLNHWHRVVISGNLRVWYEFSIDKTLISAIMEPTQSEFLWYYLWYIAPHVFAQPVFDIELDNQCDELYREMKDKVLIDAKSYIEVEPSRVKLLGWCESHATVEYNNISRSCYDKETEVYTNNGWKLFSDLNSEDKILTLNKDGFAEFQQPISYISYRYSGELHSYQSQNCDLLITPDHNLYMKYHDVRNKEDYQLIPSNQKRDVGRIRFRKHFQYDNVLDDNILLDGFVYNRRNRNGDIYQKASPDLNINRESFYKLLAWYIAEGSVYNFGTNKAEYNITIWQNDLPENADNRQRIIDCIQKCGLHPTQTKRGIQFKSQTIGKFLKSMGKCNEKYIPFNLFEDFNGYYAKVFIDEYSLSDASNDNGHIKLLTTSRLLSDQLQILCFMAGYTAIVWKQEPWPSPAQKKDGELIHSKLPMYIVSISKGNRNREPVIKRKHFSLVSYNDYVYCVTVPNHIIYIRRNGITLWCGNCHNQIVRHRRMSHSAESLRYCEPGENTVLVIPDHLSLEVAGMMGRAYQDIIALYDILRDDYRVKKEDARAILPLNVSTNQVMSGDVWAWDVFFEQRCAKDAQKEIRQLALATRELLESTGVF